MILLLRNEVCRAVNTDNSSLYNYLIMKTFDPLYRIIPHPNPPYPILYCSVLSHPILPNPLSCHILSCHILVGPARSGSIFHIDPNQTNAWNVCVKGRKKWIFYPPSQCPPGVVSSPDGADVTGRQNRRISFVCVLTQ